MDLSLDGPPQVRTPAIDSAAGRASRILSLRDSVIRIRGLATRSRTGFREQLLALARDTERHVNLLEAVRAKATAI